MSDSDIIEASKAFVVQQGIQKPQRPLLFGETNIIEECYHPLTTLANTGEDAEVPPVSTVCLTKTYRSLSLRTAATSR